MILKHFMIFNSKFRIKNMGQQKNDFLPFFQKKKKKRNLIPKGYSLTQFHSTLDNISYNDTAIVIWSTISMLISAFKLPFANMVKISITLILFFSQETCFTDYRKFWNTERW